MLGIGDPRTDGGRLSRGCHGLPTASRLVSARVGIDGALSLRHLRLCTFLLSTSFLPLSGGLPTPASIDSCRTSGPSPTISASRLVVVKMRSSLVAGAFGGLPNPARRKFLSIVIRLAVVLAPVLVASVFWAAYRNHGSSAAPAKAVTAARSPASPSISQETAHLDSSSSEGLSNAQSAILFSVAPLTSLPAISTSVDPDPVASFRQLIALPFDTAHEAPHIDPRKMRAIFDRGVVGYASARTDKERAKSASLIQTVALVGFSPARDLLARNYPQSEAMRSVVPANDVIRYALDLLMGVGATSEDSEQIFLALGQHFALQGQLDLFAAQLLNLMRGDSRPKLGYRIDNLLDVLARVPGACRAFARLVPDAGNAADRECAFREKLRKYIETTAPVSEEEEESKRRGLILLNQLGGR